MTQYGPTLPISDWIHTLKYRGEGETFKEAMIRVADGLKDGDTHYLAFKDILLNMRFMPAGRVQSAIGAPRAVTPYNCFVSNTIKDSMNGIMEAVKEAAETMRLGGGIGYDFSTLRPKNDLIRSLDTKSSGPVSFMGIFDAVCKTIASAGHRRGAQMGVLRVDHPDIEEFVRAKANKDNLTQFNLSVGVTDKFMEAVEADSTFDLVFEGRVYKTVRARPLWNEILRTTWDWAEPGILFIDKMNRKNNLWYCEKIAATNPCVSGETPILTKNGYVPIIDLVGKSVDIWNGEEWSKVTPFETGENDLVRVHLSDGNSLDCTWHHRWVIDGKGFVETKDLSIGMALEKFAMPVVTEGTTPNSDPYSQGFYSGDGNRGYKTSYLYSPKYVCEPRLIGECVNDAEGRKRWKHGPMLDKSYVPTEANLQYRLEWLAGLLDSDGTVTRDVNGSGFQITSVDHQFLRDLQLMLTTMGVRAKIALGNREGFRPMPDGAGGVKDYFCKEVRRILIGNSDAHDLMELGLKLSRLVHDGSKPQRDARRFVRVTSIEPLDRHETTYCFTEPKTNRGTFNGIVTGQCGEQPLPPYGACLLGSLNLTRYVKKTEDGWVFDYEQLEQDLPHIIRAMDNVVDRAIYPLPQQEAEAKNKRRMGIGVTGVANAGEALGLPYGSEGFNSWLASVMEAIRDGAYRASINLAKEKGPFPLFSVELLESEFAKTLPEDIRKDIATYGLRNSHLLSVAPTGTISLSADNISSGIEPVFSHSYNRTIQTGSGEINTLVEDYGVRVFGVKGRTADQCSVFDHVDVLTLASQYVDSACSKTCNVGDDVTWDEFKEVYMRAWRGGASGCTTFRASGKRYGILNAAKAEEVVEEPEKEVDTFIDEKEGGACYYDPETGKRTCE